MRYKAKLSLWVGKIDISCQYILGHESRHSVGLGIEVQVVEGSGGSDSPRDDPVR